MENEFNYLINHAFEKNGVTYSSYMAMLQSKVVVGNCSTMLRENLAVGGNFGTCGGTVDIDHQAFIQQGQIFEIEYCLQTEKKPLINLCFFWRK
mgnify:CR=1 FL=1